MTDHNKNNTEENSESTKPNIAMAGSDDAAIERLANMSIIAYERVREEEAKQFGIPAHRLDRLVKESRNALKKGDSETRELSLPEYEPYPEAVNGKALLDDLAATFNRFVKLPHHADTALALWVCFTWLIHIAKVAPIMAVTSPERRCGKTTVLGLLNRLVLRPLPAGNISASSIYRAIEKYKPTIMIDEADTFIHKSDEIAGILNCGHTRDTAFVLRTTTKGDDHDTSAFSTWGAKAIASISMKKLPEPLRDRSIILELKRKLVSEKMEKLRYADNSIFTGLCSKLARFAQDNADAISNARPVLPDDISDRAADNWEFLIAIAELGGKEWKARALEAVQALSSIEKDPLALGTELLEDIRAIFIKENCSKISTGDLIRALCANDEKPWATYNRYGNTITPRQLANFLSEYSIHSKTIRIDNRNTPKGYERAQFEEAFNCYLSPTSLKSATPPQDAYRYSDFAIDEDDEAEESTNINCGVVAFQNPRADMVMMPPEEIELPMYDPRVEDYHPDNF